MLQSIKRTWLFNVRGDMLAGITATLALIPDCIAFAFIAGVDPMVGFYSAICMLIILAFFGGRPAMLSSSAGSMAVLMTALVARHGVEYLFAATVLTGVLQWFMGVFKMGRWMKYIPRSVVVGFINALAILILVAQLRHFHGESWGMYAMVALTLAVIFLWPRLSKAIPSPLIAVALVTGVAFVVGWNGKTVGDIADIASGFPLFHMPDVPLNAETLLIIFPYAFSLALVGFIETLLTQDIVDEMTDTKTNKDREMKGQGIANAATGFFGGMAGCALIAESAINVKLGGRGRLSNLTAGVVLLLLVACFGSVLKAIPVAALVGVMLMVCFEIFDWKFLGQIRSLPILDTVVMLVTVVVSVVTDNLAFGVLAGVGLFAVSAVNRRRRPLTQR
ncbi:SulP family inorganic anion transporter [Cohnella faecalis]|uniref:SulP family inorganic anion transporter n=1 Tax=Cohnella faecalis TaxID=2315694 RepID=UPI0011C21C4F|nr:SulP family inorganic anion transporter [Cohnella faecalis]